MTPRRFNFNACALCALGRDVKPLEMLRYFTAMETSALQRYNLPILSIVVFMQNFQLEMFRT